MKRIIITGANGIIGTELCKRFIDKDYNVIGVDRSKAKQENNKQFQYIKLDITDKEKVKGDKDSIFFATFN